MSTTSPSTSQRAVLVGVQLPGVSDVEHAADLAELGRLAHTLGYEVEATLSQRRDALAAAAVLGEGKLRELSELTGGKGTVPSGAPKKTSKARARREAEEENGAARRARDPGRSPEEATADSDPDAPPRPVVLVDHEISPSQARNLEKATGTKVLDRTGVIVEIFHRHARSREARLQVEIARLSYVAPRLRETGGSERQGGRGAGESMLELDRRKIRDRIAELREELATIATEQEGRRHARREQLRVALVGYTNAGKSSLMRALTGSKVLVADKLFATLDTTVRTLSPETRPRILVSDTVGFIKKLPHDLVASFRSTLDEAREASLLLYIVDSSDPTHEAELEVTRGVLSDIGAGSVPSRLIMNKVDRLDPADRFDLEASHPDALFVSAKNPDDAAKVHQAILDFFEQSMTTEELFVPYSRQAVISEIYESARVLGEQYEEAGTRLEVRGLPTALAQLRRTLEH